MQEDRSVSRLIVGLGNPGPKYASTRHNAGFEVADRTAERLGTGFGHIPEANSMRAAARYRGVGLYIQKPLTFMNRSGEAVLQMTRRLKISPGEILLVYDCLDLPLGRIRFRSGGSSGGHRGVQSVIEQLQTQQFARLRIGIGRPDREAVDYVLSQWTPGEKSVFQQGVDVSAEAVLHFITDGLVSAMNKYNGWRAETET